MQVALFYGMSQPGASDTPAAHAMFAIDPLWILRAMVCYPMSNGLSFNELLRLVEALQTSDAHGVATPEAWQPSDEVVVTPLNSEDAPSGSSGPGGAFLSARHGGPISSAGRGR